MTEKLLQYIWQFQYFNKSSLITTEGQLLLINFQGTHNTNQGPDFLEANIKLNETTWLGNIELHVLSSDWIKHKHRQDSNYRNIILHVVWQEDVIIDEPFPTLILQSLVPKWLLNKYNLLMQSGKFIPCEKNLKNIQELTLIKWKERLLIERLQQKTKDMLLLLQKNHYHWDETLWWLLAKNFGMHQNGEAFFQIAQSIPIVLLMRHRHSIIQLEALLMGQGGLLNKTFSADYSKQLQKEYFFLQQKYQLVQPAVSLFFLRMRPANFPTIRLAQLAALIAKDSFHFEKNVDLHTLSYLQDSLLVSPSGYWNEHYLLDEKVKFKNKKLGKQMIENIIINTWVPLIYTYGYYNNDEEMQFRAIEWLENISSEKNTIIQGFDKLEIKSMNAADSQALLQLKKHYCNGYNCLNCSIGNAILVKSEIETVAR